MIDRMIWCEQILITHFHYGFCPSDRALRRELKRLDCDSDISSEASSAVTHHLTNDGIGRHMSIVMVNKSEDVHDPCIIVGLLAHEAIHVLDRLLMAMNDDKGSPEFRAYALQAITMGLINAYERTRRPLLVHQKRKEKAHGAKPHKA